MHLAYGFMLFKFDANISYGASLYLFCISVIAFVGEFIIGKNWNSVNENSQIKSLENLPRRNLSARRRSDHFVVLSWQQAMQAMMLQ